jgi:hypothetical protein
MALHVYAKLRLVSPFLGVRMIFCPLGNLSSSWNILKNNPSPCDSPPFSLRQWAISAILTQCQRARIELNKLAAIRPSTTINVIADMRPSVKVDGNRRIPHKAKIDRNKNRITLSVLDIRSFRIRGRSALRFIETLRDLCLRNLSSGDSIRRTIPTV